MIRRSTLRLSFAARSNLSVNRFRPRYNSSTSGDADIELILAKPTWSVRSLLPDPATKPSSPSVTPEQLRHLLRLSALPQPSSPAEEQRMLEMLESQIHFVREIQKVDTTGVEPLQSIRDETPEAVKENTIGLEQLKEALSKERVVGRNKKIQRIESTRNDHPDGDAWDGNALGYASKTKGKFFVNFNNPFGSAPKAESNNDQDLTTILSRPRRADLTVLIAEITQHMRDLIDETFKASPAQHPAPPASNQLIDLDDEHGASRPDAKKLTKSEDEHARTEYVPTSEDLKAEANLLTQFDDWRDAVLLRIGEVVNRETEDENGESNFDSQDDQRPQSSPLSEVYHPVKTPLIRLPKPKRFLKHYNANSRVLMLYAASSLGLGIKTLNQDEVNLPADPDAQTQRRGSDPTRKWKVGIASVAGAVLIGVTGGLAAPFIAAGLGTVMGGLGLGATAAAGYLGAVAGSGVIVGGLFGAYGGRMTGRMVEKYAREVDDFAFLPIHGSRHRSDDEREAAQEDHRLRVTIGITGWLTEESNFVVPWRVIGKDSEVFGLRWETESLMNLGNAIDYLVTSAAWSAGREVMTRTIFAGLLSALMLPMGLLQVAKIADNPFSIAKARSDKAGEVLADALINKVQGERPVTLIGYSLGLAERHAYGLVESVILMGSPTPSDTLDWRRIRRVNDSVLAFLYRTKNVPGVENLDYLLGRILRTVGLECISAREVAREEAALVAKDRQQEQQRIQNERRAGIEGDSDAARRKLESGELAAGEELKVRARADEARQPIPRRPVPSTSAEEDRGRV
ncbi:hypothetical protein BDW62DRAFT_210720 [Aspergillus aurantiobrunneus]